MKLPLNVDLKGKVAVVTGGGGVLCGCFAKAIAASGAKVAVLDLNKKSADEVADAIIKDGGEAIGVEANVLKRESLLEAKRIVNEAFGSCDILINGAGGNHPKGTTTKEYYEKGDECDERPGKLLRQRDCRFAAAAHKCNKCAAEAKGSAK